ncbi:MAG: hypothetical protein II777_04150 [Clostridia bacterium]|nr:hypothetical protein [Clostridia bacterium]
MKTLRKIIVCLLVLAITAAMSVTVYGAIEAEAGKSVTVTFTVEDVYGVDGYFEFSNRSLFKSIKYSYSGKISGDISNDKIFLYGSNEVDVKITVTASIAKNAKVGSSCDIKLTYEKSDVNGSMSDWMEMTKTVKVKAAPPPDTEPPTTAAPVTEPPETEPPVTEPKIDYTELLRQIEIATSLIEFDYTTESWARVAAALEKAKELLESKSQSEVDNGARELADAISALVRVNYGALRKAVERAKGLDEACAHGNLWFKLTGLLAQADKILVEGEERDQAKADELAAKINETVDEILRDYANHSKETQIVKEFITVEVPIEPTDPYCNIPMHKVWPVLFFIALGIILILTALYFIFFMKRRTNRKDDMPIVDYDIADDDVTKEL